MVPSSPRVDRAEVLAATESRSPPPKTGGSTPRLTTAYEYEDFDDKHKLRKEFRRLINPGVIRKNDQFITLQALKLLTEIAENILKNPDDDKYLQVKQTGRKVQKYIMEPKGTVEYLLKLGFRNKVMEFQPYFVFDRIHMEDLRVGTHCLKESLNTETNKKVAEELAKRQQAANEQAVKTKVDNAFYDDRRKIKERDERERVARVARATAALQRHPLRVVAGSVDPVSSASD